MIPALETNAPSAAHRVAPPDSVQVLARIFHGRASASVSRAANEILVPRGHPGITPDQAAAYCRLGLGARSIATLLSWR